MSNGSMSVTRQIVSHEPSASGMARKEEAPAYIGCRTYWKAGVDHLLIIGDTDVCRGEAIDLQHPEYEEE